MISTFLVFLVIPAGPDIVVKDLNVGVFYALAVSSLSVIGVLMAGWASANKFSLLGALRAAAQLIAYELPLLLAVVGVVIQAGTMSLQGIVAFQSTGSIFGWSGIGFPLILTQFIGFGLFLVASQAELTQTPFDMPVAESELVAGYMVEYTGFRFLFFFIGEFGTAFAFSAIAATLFLGGWALPGVVGDPARRDALPRARSCCSPRSWSSRSSCSGCASRTRACVRTSCRRWPGSSSSRSACSTSCCTGVFKVGRSR